MTGPEHWHEADLILTGDPCEYGCPLSGCPHEMRQLARAQVHAALAATAFAAAAESVRLGALPPSVLGAWREAAGTEDEDAAPAAAGTETAGA